MRRLSPLAERLRKLRAQRGDSQVVVADAVGLSRSGLAGIETDQDAPGRETLVALANYYGVSLDWLASGEGESDEKLSQREAELIAHFRTLSPDQQDFVLTAFEVFARRPKPAEPKRTGTSG